MFDRISFLAIAGFAALGAGIVLFLIGASQTNWMVGLAGILFWFLGGALVACWAAERIYVGDRTRREEQPGNVQPIRTVRPMKKAS